MRALVQRVTSAAVTLVDSGELAGEIGTGLCVLVGVARGDTGAAAARVADKVWNLRVFPDEGGDMNRSLADRVAAGSTGEVLVVSQFTLYGDTRRGRRPSFVEAAPPDQAEPLVEAVVEGLRALGASVATGRFRTDMSVAIVNDGPVTLMVEVDA